MARPAKNGLIIYKRHNANCKVWNRGLKRGTEKFWFECECPFWVCGHTPAGDEVPRQSCSTNVLAEAEECRRILIRASNANADSPAEEAVDPEKGHTLAWCAAEFLKSHKHEWGDKCYRQHQRVMDDLVEFCGDRGVYYSRQLDVDVLESFKANAFPERMKDTSKATLVAKLRVFLYDAYRRGWSKEALREKVGAHKCTFEQKEPYKRKQLDLIYGEALKMKGGTHAFAKHPKTFVLLLALMEETGMRVGDALWYDPSEEAVLWDSESEQWIYTYEMQKRRKTDKAKFVETYISDELKNAIDNCHWLSPTHPFRYGNHSRTYLASEIYYRMQAIGERCGVEDCRPHRLRDTFAILKLLQGVKLEEVSRLLGHSSVSITEKFYAKWVTDRTRQLRRIAKQSRVNTGNQGLGYAAMMDFPLPHTPDVVHVGAEGSQLRVAV